MLIIPIRLRFALMAVFLLGGVIVSFLPYGLAWSWLLLIPGIILLVGYFLFGTIASASQLLQQGQIDAAEERLKLTYKPEWLLSMNRGTYYFIHGAIETQRKNFEGAEKYMNQALEIGMPTDDFTAQIHLFLAQIAASKNKMNQARNALREAKNLNVTDPQVLAAIKQIETELKKIPKRGMTPKHQQMMRSARKQRRR